MAVGRRWKPSVFGLTRAAFVLGRTLYIDGGEYTSKSNGNVNIRSTLGCIQNLGPF